jgi:NADPH:quinone reductase-like Zn-dependent oxidoreductase
MGSDLVLYSFTKYIYYNHTIATSIVKYLFFYIPAYVCIQPSQTVLPGHRRNASAKINRRIINMKAVLFYEHGGIEKIRYEDIEEPRPGRGEVVVRVKAAALNHLDIWVRQGLPGIKLKLPHIMGSDCAGIVESLGDEISGIKVGDQVILDPSLPCTNCNFCLSGEQSQCINYRIIGEQVDGTFAELFKVPAGNLHPLPENISFEAGAAFALTFMTAWRLLITRGNLLAGETLLIWGIGGGVALAALQIAKLCGVTVVVTSGSEQKLEKAKSLGADILLNHKEVKVTKEVQRITAGMGVDMVLDTVGEATWVNSLKSLRKGGRLVTCGATTGGHPATDIQRIFWNQLSILGSTMGSKQDFIQVYRLFKNGKLKPYVDKTFPLKDAALAQQYMEAGKQFGKIVLTPM